MTQLTFYSLLCTCVLKLCYGMFPHGNISGSSLTLPSPAGAVVLALLSSEATTAVALLLAEVTVKDLGAVRLTLSGS